MAFAIFKRRPQQRALLIDNPAILTVITSLRSLSVHYAYINQPTYRHPIAEQ